ncbi:Naphthalene 1,2-dioxygenase/salicylate 5-hydroxylase system, ferredoxin component [Planctomycetes bacterium Pla163]|jgi:nitrite reductase/ring-hydroxylating ferredoxin subunit|uniref:Naphthalene 1,2-dioxygenase/salicylate 5-hydroxylase system, ferredoxin component n=1 Tax=Rohdeia mirabilis TaxID=2528008 RepID=A0A518CWG4_9BACT|nr:Naphthalene 1,2-dioxygenase/salicylate 5-hydroxylase system, ferredoxin component [Planctomycetes bacterium Pla163]
MLKRLLGFFRSEPIRIEGSSKLPEGVAHKISVGDPVAGTGRDVLLVRLDGEVHAIDNQCPHAAAFIADGALVEGKFLVCPLHNYRFDPKTGNCVNASCRKARRYKTVEKDGNLELYV